VNIWKIIVFYLISPVYALIFRFQVKKYYEIIQKVRKQYDLSGFHSVIDLGCGNGALCYAFDQNGCRVTGVDALSGMVGIAKRNLKDTDIELARANIMERLPFEDKSFDIAVSSYVLHGMNQKERQKMYDEMTRIARKAIIFHDYNHNKSILTSIIEGIEGGSYFDFLKLGEQEMRSRFSDLKVIDVDKRAAWYINTL
jgi:ubiquinone/menaquinone biosynthesis C-methylase UbiE